LVLVVEPPSRSAGELKTYCLSKGPRLEAGGFFLVRPAGRTLLEVKVLYTPGKGKC
jgi:hypothetical protein